MFVHGTAARPSPRTPRSNPATCPIAGKTGRDQNANSSEMFRGSPVTRARYSGFLRNVAVAMGNAGCEKFRGPLKRWAQSEDPLVAEPPAGH